MLKMHLHKAAVLNFGALASSPSDIDLLEQAEIQPPANRSLSKKNGCHFSKLTRSYLVA
jgi:hypothetical protein